jgi:hypothetical protein
MAFPWPARIQWIFLNGTHLLPIPLHIPFDFTFCPFTPLENTRITRKSTAVFLTTDWHTKRDSNCFSWGKNWNLKGYLNLILLTKTIGPVSLHVLAHCLFSLILWRISCYLLTYGAESFFRSCQLCSHSRTSQHFMEPEGTLPCSQEPHTYPYPELEWFSPYHSILSL